MGDHVLTLVAYAGIGVATGWWFWRAHGGFVHPTVHAAVAIVFGLLWPLSLPWRALVRALSRGLATRRARRAEQAADDDQAGVKRTAT